MDQDRMDALSPREQHELQVESARSDEELQRAGKLLAADALDAPRTVTCIRKRGGALSITDGPFVETKEHLGGFMLLEVRDREEAIRILTTDDRFLDLGTTFELRPIHDYRAALARERPAG
jgi:hypothetical protein